MNQAQKKAMTHRDGPCLVLAGPGSGKTLVIVHRIKYLIEECKVRPEEILVITFTKYAAAEMKQRLNKLLGGKAAPVTAGTFHGIYYGILKWECGIGPESILSEEEKYKMLKQILGGHREENTDREELILELLSEIGIVKNSRISLEEYEAKACDTGMFRKIYREYTDLCRKDKKIDFDDMLILCYDLFVRKPEVLRRWQRKFRYILIDEFQDINRVQYDVIRMLAEPERNLFVVGDDDQSIYGFRGADVEFLFRFLREYPEARQILLDVNYRSRENIVRSALRVIGHNKMRFPKNIRADREAGTVLHVQETEDSLEESSYIVGEIAGCRKKGIPAEEIAVLYRVHTDARALAEKLTEAKISFQMRDYLPNLYRHFIAEDISAYFRMALGGRARADFLRIANRPCRYIARDSVADCREVSFEKLRCVYQDKEWMQEYIDTFEQDLAMLGKMAPYAAIYYLRKRIGYDDFLRKYALDKGIKKEELLEVLFELEEAAKPFATLKEWFSHVEAYTEALRLAKQKEKGKGEGVRLLSMHAAKGLEFDTVFIIQANEGRMPCKKAAEENTEEERRLFYVAMTRAKNRLYITYVRIKNGKEAGPSRFVEELFEGI